MPLIYQPSGAALEYCPGNTLALNPYQGLCPHRCHRENGQGYDCYANSMIHRFRPAEEALPYGPKPNLLEQVDAEAAVLAAKGFTGRIHLSFMGDVYAAGVEQTTREVLLLLKMTCGLASVRRVMGAQQCGLRIGGIVYG